MSAPKPSLRDHLLLSLSALANTSKLHVVSLTSAPKRITSLFPHTPNPPRCFQVDYFVVLGCEVDVPPATAEATTASSGSDPAPGPNATGGNGTSTITTPSIPTPSAPASSAATSEKQLVLTSAISAHLYILPHSQTSILYISKVDSSSYPSPSPLPLTRTLITSFISYFLLPLSRPTPDVRVQLFARSQGQYLFPNSEKGKKGLGGARLCGWWKGVYEDVARILVGPQPRPPLVPPPSGEQPHARETSFPKLQHLSMEENKVPPSQIHLAYVLPSFTQPEALGVLGAPRLPLPAPLEWKYEPPFSTPIPGVGKNKVRHTGPKAWRYLPGFSLADLIPSLEDDPKTRFLEEVATSTGEEYGGGGSDKEDGGGMDDEAEDGHGDDGPEGNTEDGAVAVPSNIASAGSSSLDPSQPPQPHKSLPKNAAGKEDKAYRSFAYRRLRRITPAEFWERIGFRGECAMDVTGFFTLMVDSPTDWGAVLAAIPPPVTSTTPTPTPTPAPPPTNPDPIPSPGSLPPAIVDRIQQALMNTDFSTLDWALQGSGDWLASARQIIAGEIGQDALEGYCEGVVAPKSAQEMETLRREGKGEKRAREEGKEVVVTVLQPRKKKKV